MGRSLNDIIAALPAEEQAAIDARYQDLKQEVEGFRELRQIAGKAQAEIASALNIKQPSVSQIERQTDMYLSTLRSYVKAVGGELEFDSQAAAAARIADSPARRCQRSSTDNDPPSWHARADGWSA